MISIKNKKLSLYPSLTALLLVIVISVFTISGCAPDKSTKNEEPSTAQTVLRTQTEATSEDGVVISNDSSDFVLLSDVVPDVILEIRYFGEQSHPDYTGITNEQYNNRMILRDAMVSGGFVPVDVEWWHFTLENEPYPETYFTFPVNSDSLK